MGIPSHGALWDPLAALTPELLERLEAYERLVVESNRRINLVARSSVKDFRRVHTIHSLALSRRSAGRAVNDGDTTVRGLGIGASGALNRPTA